MISLRFENITKLFGQTVAVDDLSLEIGEGELFFMLGPSGCGKTTCLRMVAGFYQPDAGLLRFDDRVMNTVAPHRRNTGMVFQNYALWPHMTAFGNVEYGLKVRKVARPEREQRVREALEMVQLGNLAQRYPNQLSGGQQQRVALARALVIRPNILLLDEPLSNLDAQLRIEMRREIRRLHQQTGTTALYVTHDQDEALSIADRIALLKDGVLQQVGTPRELYRRPCSRFVAGFIGETNVLPGQIARREADALTIDTPAGTLASGQKNAGTFAVGQDVWCSIRPESWRLLAPASASAPAENRVRGQLASVMYLGEIEQYQVQLDAGEAVAGDNGDWRNVKVSVMNPGGLAPPSGSEVLLHCDPLDVVVLGG